MKLYISGKITGEKDYKSKFERGESEVEIMGHIPYNPSKIQLPKEANYEEYMHMCFAMLDICDGIYMLNNWQESKGANRELGYAIGRGKVIFYQDDRTAFIWRQK